MSDEKRTSAFRFSYNSVVDSLKTMVTVESNGQKLNVIALWDTGANCCAISEKVAQTLQLVKSGETTIHTPAGAKRVNTYLIDKIHLPNNVTVPDVRVMDSDIGAQGIDLLIGMNIISLGDLLVSNNGHTVFSFRTPPKPIPDLVTGISINNLINKHGKKQYYNHRK